jgi:hypothetical protein
MKWHQVASICIFGTIATLPFIAPVLAHTSQYPTEAEIQSALEDLPQAVREVPGPGARDIRSIAEVETLTFFVEEWSQVDSSIAPFLGTYEGLGESLQVYPSRTRGQVCIIRSGYGSNGTWNLFGLGTVIEHQIYTTGDLGQYILFEQRGGIASKHELQNSERDYLALVGIDNGQAELSAWSLPTPLGSPSADIIQKFNESGCTTALP